MMKKVFKLLNKNVNLGKHIQTLANLNNDFYLDDEPDYHAPFILIETTPPMCSICRAPITNMSCNLVIKPTNCPIENKE